MEYKLYEEFYIYLPGVKLKFEEPDAPIVKRAYYDANKRKLEDLELENLTFEVDNIDRELCIKMNKILYTESYFRKVI